MKERPSFPLMRQTDVQSIYHMLSVAARKFNAPILEHITQSGDYPTLKSVCEGRELPAYEAASEFVARTAGELDSLLSDIGGEKNALNTLEKLEQGERQARQELAELLEPEDLRRELAEWLQKIYGKYDR